MQWTNDSGAAYGQDPYAGAGYPYAHGQGHGYGHGYTYGHEHGGTAAADTATLPWSPEPAYGTHPGEAAFATGTYPHAPGTHLYPAGPGPAATTWDARYGDAPTAPPPEFGTPVLSVPEAAAEPPPGPEPAPDAASEAVRPVFVDSSGRRQRRVLRATRLLLIPAGGYVALLISTVLGGPSISSPVVPQPHSPHPAAPGAAAPDSAPGTHHSSGTTDSVAASRNSRSTATRAAAGPTGRPAGSSTPVATSGTTAAPTRTTSPTPTSTPTATTTAGPTSAFQGRGAGSTHNPVK